MDSGKILKTWRSRDLNVIILEVDYNFAFKSTLNLGEEQIRLHAMGTKIRGAMQEFNIRLIPEFQSLGHQSWKAETLPLLSIYPAFDLTPERFPITRVSIAANGIRLTQRSGESSSS